MRLSIAPLTSRIRQRLPGARPLESFATESQVVQAAEVRSMRPAVYAPGELERVRGVHEFSAGIADELQLATRNAVEHTATIAWRLRNLCVSQSRLCNLHSYRPLTFGKTPSAPARLIEITEPIAFCSSAGGNDYFAHLLLDDASTALLGREFGATAFGGSRRPRTPHERDYLELFGIDYREVDSARLRDAWLFTDHAQNAHRRARLEALRTAIRNRYAGGEAAPPAYLRRGLSGTKRHLVNEAELEAALERRGFRVVDPETLDADAICALLRDTPLVVGVEGSQLAHGLLNLRKGGGLLCIEPATRFNAVYRSFCDSLELEWGFVVAEGSAAEFSLPVERLLHTIDLLTRRTGMSC